MNRKGRILVILFLALGMRILALPGCSWNENLHSVDTEVTAASEVPDTRESETSQEDTAASVDTAAENDEESIQESKYNVEKLELDFSMQRIYDVIYSGDKLYIYGLRLAYIENEDTEYTERTYLIIRCNLDGTDPKVLYTYSEAERPFDPSLDHSRLDDVRQIAVEPDGSLVIVRIDIDYEPEYREEYVLKKIDSEGNELWSTVIQGRVWIKESLIWADGLIYVKADVENMVDTLSGGSIDGSVIEIYDESGILVNRIEVQENTYTCSLESLFLINDEGVVGLFYDYVLNAFYLNTISIENGEIIREAESEFRCQGYGGLSGYDVISVFYQKSVMGWNYSDNTYTEILSFADIPLEDKVWKVQWMGQNRMMIICGTYHHLEGIYVVEW